MGTLIYRETVVEYFKELVEGALVHQRVHAGELTSYYVVNLLAGFAGRPKGGTAERADEALALRLARALQSAGARQRNGLREVGDLSLFISGFFSDSLNRTPVDLDYYITMGGYAYSSLSRRDDESFAPVFGELAEKFVDFVDILSEVSERSALTSNTDLLRAYEKWLRTGSRREGERLAERGIVPNESIKNRFLQ